MTQDGKVEIQISSEELRKRKIMIATPMYGGQCAGIYTKSCTDLVKLAASYGVQVEFFYLFNESLITRARNYLVDEFLRSDFTHMVFIDSDIGFDPRDVLALVALADGEEKEIVCGPYPKKAISWEKIKRAVDKGFADNNPNVLERYVGDYVFNPVGEAGNEIRLDQPVEVLEGGTGFMCVTRSAFEKFDKEYPQQRYKPDHVRTKNFDGSREIMAYFDTVIDPDTKRYLSEDYMFCQWSRNAGVKVWLCPWMKLVHMGSYMFGGSLVDLAQIGAAATVGNDFKIK